MTERSLRVAVEGCGHGTLNAIYSSIQKSCEINGWDGIDLLIIGGDFQAVRNSYDLNCMSVPLKYREIGDFHEYYAGARKAPYLTIFVGGNHEASNHLWELYYGGWVAPNIYYLGAANVLRLGPLRIAGLSGIWKGYNYNKPHYERLPYNQNDVKSIYHVREFDVRKLLQIRTQVDIGISHDWPRGIEWKGNWKALFAKKDLFEADARAGTLGSPAAKYVMDRLRPPHWFSAHLHCKFSAIERYGQETSQQAKLPHVQENALVSGIARTLPSDNRILAVDRPGDNVSGDPSTTQSAGPVQNNDEIEIDLDDKDDINGTASPAANLPEDPNPIAHSSASNAESVPEDLRAQLPAAFLRPERAIQPTTLPAPPDIKNTVTHFLALDKCLPNRKFLQILEISSFGPSHDSFNANKPLRLSYDKEWLAITRTFADCLPLGDSNTRVSPNKGEAVYRRLIEADEMWVEEHIVAKDKMIVPENFELTAPAYDATLGTRVRESPKEYTNSQTSMFCEMLGIGNPFHASEAERAERQKQGAKPEEPRAVDSEGRYRGGGRGGGRSDRGGHRHRGRGRGRGRSRGFR